MVRCGAARRGRNGPVLGRRNLLFRAALLANFLEDGAFLPLQLINFA